jgi:hypothetical protein
MKKTITLSGLFLTTLGLFGQLSINQSLTNISCYNGNNGAITITVSGGQTPYKYLWSNGATTKNISGVKAGSYQLQVKDDNNTIIYANYQLTQPQPLTIEVYIDKPYLCAGASTFASAATQGGTGSLTYKWNDPLQQTSFKAVNLKGGTYTVEVKDQNNCTESKTMNIIEYPEIIASQVSLSDVTCKGGNNGSVAISLSGGKTPYTYLWSSGETTKNSAKLFAGINNITVTDNIGCKAIKSFTITEPNYYFNINPDSIEIKNLNCYHGDDGSIKINSKDTTLYTIQWISTNSSGLIYKKGTISGLSAGNYMVTVTDDKACSVSAAFQLHQPYIITIDSTTFTLPINNKPGKINVFASGGSGLFYYSIDGGNSYHNNNGNFDSVPEGRYFVVVKDFTGCVKQGNIINIIKSTYDSGTPPSDTIIIEDSSIVQPPIIIDTTQPRDSLGSNLSVKEQIDEEFVFDIYPNPTGGQFYVEFKNKEKDNFSIQLYNVIGETIYSKQYASKASHVWVELDISNQPKGIYIVQIKGPNLNLKGKVIKQK